MPFHNVKDVGEQRRQLREIIFSCWPACSAPDPEHPDVPFMVCSFPPGMPDFDDIPGSAQDKVLQCFLHIPQVEFAADTVESTAKTQKSGESWGMCSKHCDAAA